MRSLVEAPAASLARILGRAGKATLLSGAGNVTGRTFVGTVEFWGIVGPAGAVAEATAVEELMPEPKVGDMPDIDPGMNSQGS